MISRSFFQQDASEFPWHHTIPLRTYEAYFYLCANKRHESLYYGGLEMNTKYQIWVNATKELIECIGGDLIVLLKEICGSLDRGVVLARCSIRYAK